MLGLTLNLKLVRIGRMVDISQRMIETERQIKAVVADSTAIMVEKNRQRGDAWRGSGLLGQFIEIYSMYQRLKNLLWDIGPDEFRNLTDNKAWFEAILNALQDMRNFTILAELCLKEKNYDGRAYPDITDLNKCPKCGKVV